MATLNGKTPSGRWSSIQVLAWSVVQADTWYQIEEIGCPGGSTSGTVSARTLMRATISAVAATTATINGRINLRSTVVGTASSTVTALARLALRALASITGSGSGLVTGQAENLSTGQPFIVYTATFDTESSLSYATQQNGSVQYATKQS